MIMNVTIIIIIIIIIIIVVVVVVVVVVVAVIITNERNSFHSGEGIQFETSGFFLYSFSIHYGVNLEI